MTEDQTDQITTAAEPAGPAAATTAAPAADISAPVADAAPATKPTPAAKPTAAAESTPAAGVETPQAPAADAPGPQPAPSADAAQDGASGAPAQAPPEERGEAPAGGRPADKRPDKQGRPHGRDQRRRGKGEQREPREQRPQGPPIPCLGILDVLPDGFGFLRTSGYAQGDHDVYVSLSQIRRFGLRRGDKIEGQVREPKDNEKYSALLKIDTVNGIDPESARKRPVFEQLTPLFPEERMRLETPEHDTAARIMDLMCPEIDLFVLLVDERPEEVTDMQRSVDGEVVASTFDQPSENHVQVTELVLDRVKRLVEMGHDVVVLLDSITRMARAFNLNTPASGRILSGGVDSTALYPPKKFFGAARNIEEGGSLTILATALVDTGSRMDEVIFEEFKGTGNMEIRLDRKLADKRIFPAIDIEMTGTRKEELLMDAAEAAAVWKLRGVLHSLDPAAAIELLIKKVRETKSNAEFLSALQKNSR